MEIAEVLEAIEKGEPVNWNRVAASQPLRILKMGAEYAKESQERSRLADEQAERIIDDITNS